MSNPFIDGMDDRLRGRYVRAVSNQGRVYRGWVERIHHHERHLMLRDATLVDEDETDVGSTLVTRATEVAVLEDNSRIERIALRTIEAAPYHEREFQESENRGYVADVRDTGFVGSFPVVRPIDGDLDHPGSEGFEVVEGHKRIWACRQAGIVTHPVEIVDISDWAAACRFVADHYPDPGQVDGDGAVGSGCYEADDLAASIETLVDEWGERAFELDRVRFNAERLDLDVAGADGADPDVDVGESAEPSEPEVEVVPIEELAEDIGGLGDIGVENLEAAGFETTADLEDATKGDLRDVGRIGTKIANQLLLEVADEVHECPECDREFPTSRGREKHVSDTHAEGLQDDSVDAGAADDGQEESDLGDEEEAEPAEPEDLDTGDDIPADQQAFVLEWGRWGPPHGGTYHVDEDCFALDRSDSDREAVPLPKSRDELEDDEDWEACGHCSDTTSDDIDEEEDEPGAGEPVDEESDPSPDDDVDEVEDDVSDGADEPEPDEETFPRECHCGATLEDSLELAIHRTEEHEVPQSTLDHLDPGEFEEIVEEADGLQDVLAEVSWSTERTLRMLGIYGLEEVVGSGDRELSDVTDVEFEGVDAGAGADGESEGEADDQPQAADGGQDLATNGEGQESASIDLEELGVSREELVDAVANAQTVHQVRREMHHLSREQVADVLDALGFLEELKTGGSKRDHDAVKRAVREVTR